MTNEEMRLDMLVAQLNYENRLLRARNDRLQRCMEGLVPHLEQACSDEDKVIAHVRAFIDKHAG